MASVEVVKVATPEALPFTADSLGGEAPTGVRYKAPNFVVQSAYLGWEDGLAFSNVG